jgi:2-amino-4-hydroxy-6-hydroxymethyldihydropteridine diphosphokinase
MSRVYLGVGANLNPEDNILAGLTRLADDVELLAVSPCYRSPAVGFDGPDFINLVVEIRTDFSISELNQKLKTIEAEFGRLPNAEKYSSRALDIDILLLDDLCGIYSGISLPRSDVWKFAFVLRPLLDLYPHGICPKSGRALHEYLPKVADQELQECDAYWLHSRLAHSLFPTSSVSGG